MVIVLVVAPHHVRGCYSKAVLPWWWISVLMLLGVLDVFAHKKK